MNVCSHVADTPAAHLRRKMAIRHDHEGIPEIPSSHVPMVSHPGEVAQLIKTAAEAVLAKS